MRRRECLRWKECYEGERVGETERMRECGKRDTDNVKVNVNKSE